MRLHFFQTTLACALLVAGAGACRESRVKPGDPGEVVADVQRQGSGACEKTTVGAVAQQVRDAHPELARAGLGEDLGGDPKSTGWYDAFLRADGGFAFAFTLVGPDCGERCCNHRTFYFQTDGACRPTQVGEYAFGWSHDTVRCWYAEGQQSWGEPLDPSRKCPSP